MATIYGIADKYKLIEQLIEDGADEAIFAEALSTVDGELSEKLENYAMVIKNIESDITGIKAEKDRLGERQKSMESSIKRMKENMQMVMLASGQTKVKGEKFNFTVQKNPPSLTVLDENLIPRKFITVQEVKIIDKKSLLAEIKKGEEIEGAQITQGESLRIR